MESLNQEKNMEMEKEEEKAAKRVIDFVVISKILLVISIVQVVLSAIGIVVMAVFLQKKMKDSKDKLDEAKKIIIRDLLEQYSN